MTQTPDHILLLAGTYEARQIARDLSAEFPELRMTASFAGVVRDLPNLGVPSRIGGFGGISGLVDYLQREKVHMIIDATHPFAAQMSRNAVAAAAGLKLPLIRLERAPWRAGEGDTWEHVASMKDAVQTLPRNSRAFLAVGRKEIQLFAERTDIYGLARMIEPPSASLPDGWDLVLARPANDVEREIALLIDHRITHIVTKNSGGKSSYAKIEAARRLQLPVIMVDRPDLPTADTVSDVPELLVRVDDLLGTKRLKTSCETD
ncbi:MAG: cobalt-precorrin-6A reductase [Roseibium sp.]|uniref:cobalt-precorrin-6A reductase n=1 Tax=Roseibium sp. TaxID=1936156 RepID=UPI002637AC9F|nr:cobalt-precorrin-6A reductase [Roseibium sp.]MCV0426932.1 cobalt-precorrin-6A reductase [Roseibium sp.]